MAFEQARYEAAQARRQYHAVDPDNRLVAAELEQLWNERLLALRALEHQRDGSAALAQRTLTEAERRHLLALGADVEAAWGSPWSDVGHPKRIIRMLIEEIVVRGEGDALALLIRWAGGDHTPLRVRKNRVGQHRWGMDADVVELVTVLARQLPGKAIAPILNRSGKTTGRGNGRTRSRFAPCAIPFSPL